MFKIEGSDPIQKLSEWFHTVTGKALSVDFRGPRKPVEKVTIFAFLYRTEELWCFDNCSKGRDGVRIRVLVGLDDVYEVLTQLHSGEKYFRPQNLLDLHAKL